LINAKAKILATQTGLSEKKILAWKSLAKLQLSRLASPDCIGESLAENPAASRISAFLEMNLIPIFYDSIKRH